MGKANDLSWKQTIFIVVGFLLAAPFILSEGSSLGEIGTWLWGVLVFLALAGAVLWLPLTLLALSIAFYVWMRPKTQRLREEREAIEREIQERQ